MASLFIRPALAFLGRMAGLRGRHLYGGAAALALALAALAVPFWLAGEAAAGPLGFAGVVLALLGYGACAAALVLASMVFAGRFVYGRLRRSVGLR
jgi:hypothetical protein